MANLPGPKFDIFVTHRAQSETHAICTRIAMGSPANAELVLHRIERMIEALEYLPRRFPIAPESRRYKRELRHVVVSSFRVIYEVREETIRVMAVRHAARRYAKDLMFD